MAEGPTLKLQTKHAQTLKQMQHLIMSHEMQQAFNFLQLPIMELQSLIEQEMEQNPILEYSQDDPQDEETEEREEEEALAEGEDNCEEELDFTQHNEDILAQVNEELGEHFTQNIHENCCLTREDDKKESFRQSLIKQETSLFEHLMQQAREVFESPYDLALAETLIGSLDSHGFLQTSLNELGKLSQFKLENLEAILTTIQTFDPPGIGAVSLQQTLLIQLQRLGKEESLAYRIIKFCFDDLLYNRIPLIKKVLKETPENIIQAIRKDIAKLNIHPGTNWSTSSVQYIVPDIAIESEGEELKVTINDDPLPPLKLNPRYLKLLEDPTLSSETKDFINKKIASAKWMLRNLTERNETLVKIVHSLANSQRDFFLSPKGLLKPMTMTALALELELHESTVARAVSNKYLQTPRGLISLRSLFSTGYIAHDGSDLSSQTIIQEIGSLIKNENKLKPLSDAAISNLLEAKGIPCARRTVAKYRYALKLGNAQQRKKF